MGWETFYKWGFLSTYNWYNSGHNCSDDKNPLESTVSMGDPQVSTVHDLDDGFGVPPWLRKPRFCEIPKRWKDREKIKSNSNSEKHIPSGYD